MLVYMKLNKYFSFYIAVTILQFILTTQDIFKKCGEHTGNTSRVFDFAELRFMVICKFNG